MAFTGINIIILYDTNIVRYGHTNGFNNIRNLDSDGVIEAKYGSCFTG